MLVRHIETNAVTGETTERMVEMPDVITEAEGVELTRLATRETDRQAIRDQLAANDASRGVRAIAEALAGDPTRLNALMADQAALRARLANP